MILKFCEKKIVECESEVYNIIMDEFKKYLCKYCNSTFTRAYNLKRHMMTVHKDGNDLDNNDVEMTENESQDDSLQESNEGETDSELMEESQESTEEETDIDESQDNSLQESDEEKTTTESSEEGSQDESNLSETKTIRLVKEAYSRLFKTLEPLFNEIEVHRNELIDNGMEDEKANEQSYLDYMKKLNKGHRKSLVDLLIDMRTFQKLPLIKNLLTKALVFERKGYDYDDALRTAMSRQKYIFNNFATNMIETSKDDK